jgi:hypothetical protein
MIKKIYIVLSLIFLFSSNLFAENDKWQAGARSAAMGDASLMNVDVWAGFNNPAALAGLDNMSLGMFYENRFLVSELSYAAFAFAIPVKSGVWAVSYSRFGYSLYNENRVGLAYAMPLSDWLSMGIQFNYLNAIQPEDYGNIHVLSFDLSLLAEPIEDLYFAVHVFNPVNIDFNGDVNRSIPSVLRLGVGYHFSDKVLASVEVESDMSDYTMFKAGLEYRMFEHLSFMTGINVKPIKAAFGVAWDWENLRLDLAYSYHQELGNSPHVGISYAF